MILLCAIDDHPQTPFIYAQILAEEMGGNRASFTRFNPHAVRRQSLIDFLRLRDEKFIVIIGSSELLTLRFQVFDRVRGVWMTMSKDDLLRFGEEDENPR